MLKNRLYYQIKPLFPPSVRMSVRRWFALRKREVILDRWPILPGSEKPPLNWPGWPEGKQFALVLTHDVEGPNGLAKCRQLMELEMRLGFRSSFNFIPEGDYTVPPCLMNELNSNGFEVGVHDLHHDGKLYNSRTEFAKKAGRINRHLENWGAVGFRSGFMLHNLEWLHDLDVAYDASTFDTDPFEPQPDGVGTIFPFWVSRKGNHKAATAEPGRWDQSAIGNSERKFSDFRARYLDFSARQDGYVELPYTMPQDSTLFLLFRERHPDIWFQKLDWIARRNGMALVNVHPDYIRFSDDSGSEATFPVGHYEELLRYVGERWPGAFWNALPRNVAAFVRTISFDAPLRKKSHREGVVVRINSSDSAFHDNKAAQTCEEDLPARAITRELVSRRNGEKGQKVVLMIGYTEYISDGRVIREAEAARDGGFEVDMIGLRPDGEADVQEYRGVRVANIRQSRYRGNGLFKYAISYLEFFFRCLFKTTFLHLKRKYAVVQVHNMPDFFVFCALVPKLMGAKVLLDIHDPMAETFASKFKCGERSIFFKLLLWEERLSAWFADGVLTVHDPVKEHILLKHGMPAESISVIANFADEQVFRVQDKFVMNGKLRMIFHGTVLERYGLSNLMLALSKVKNKDRISLKIIGDGDYSEKLKRQIADLSLEDIVEFDNHFYPLHQIPKLLSNFNLGLVPIEISGINEFILPLKLLEYISMGIPPLTVRNTAIGHYFKEEDCFFYSPGKPESLAEQLDNIVEDPEILVRHREKALALRPKFVWSTQKEKYQELLAKLS